MKAQVLIRKVSAFVNKTLANWKRLLLSVYARSHSQHARLKRYYKEFSRHKQFTAKRWYLVYGESSSGGHSLLRGLSGATVMNNPPPIANTLWYESENAVYILFYHSVEEEELTSWQQLLTLLYRFRSHQPLNGILLTLELSRLLTDPSERLTDEAQITAHAISSLQKTCHCSPPLYLVLTKADRLDGFMETFNDLSLEEITQVFGYLHPNADSRFSKETQPDFQQGFSHLILSLQRRLIFSLESEHNNRGRELIACFSAQLQLFQKPLFEWLHTIAHFAATDKKLYLRGFFLTSSLQTGDSKDHLLQTISTRFDLHIPPMAKTARIGERYFIKKLFNVVLPCEPSTLGCSLVKQKHHRQLRSLFNALLPFICLTFVWGMLSGLHHSKATLSQLQDLQSQITPVLTTESHLSFNNLLPLLTLLRHMDQLSGEQRTLCERLLPMSAVLHHRTHATYNRVIESEFMPRVAVLFEHSLHHFLSMQTGTLYLLFKGYLDFARTSQTKPMAVIAGKMLFAKNFAHQPQRLALLNEVLSIGANQPLPALPLSTSLIRRMRTHLANLSPAVRGYTLLINRLRSKAHEPLVLARALSSSSPFAPSRSAISVPYEFTLPAYTSSMRKHLTNIVGILIHDQHAIGLETQNTAQLDPVVLKHQIATHYENQTLRAWQTVLKKLHIQNPKTFKQAIVGLQQLEQPHSNFERILNLSVKNLIPLAKQSTSVARYILPINDFLDGQAKIANLSEFRKSLLTLQQTFNLIATSDKPNQLALKDLIAIYNGQRSDPFLALQAIAAHCPPPIARWVNSVIINYWQLLCNKAALALNSYWTEQIYSIYHSQIANRYPFATHSIADSSLTAFSMLFSPKGCLLQFYRSYLSHFFTRVDNKFALVSRHGKQFSNLSNTRRLWQRTHFLATHYFSQKTNNPSFSYELTPYALSANARSMSLHLQGAGVTYRHGPEFTHIVHWPAVQGADSSGIRFTGFSSQPKGIQRHGVWSVFRLLQQAHSYQVNRNTWRYTFRLAPYNGVVTIHYHGKMSLFSLRVFHNFTLPKQLVGQQ